jgi:hypothetical protein
MPIHIRSIFLSGIACVFCTAFLSYHTQFPGLNSSAGIEPAGRIFPHAFPQLYRSEIWTRNRDDRNSDSSSTGDDLGDDGDEEMDDLKLFWFEVDVLCETVAILGIFLSGLAARCV